LENYKEFNKKHQHSRLVFPTLKVDGIEQLPTQAAEVMNNYFLNITGNLNIQAVKDNNPISLLKKHYPYTIPPMQTVPVTEGEIRGIISSMKPKNSSGHVGISTKILKLCGSQISRPLAFIIDKSIKTGVFSERLKYALITPLHKKGDVRYIIWLITD
jgi:hypothetical protein